MKDFDHKRGWLILAGLLAAIGLMSTLRGNGLSGRAGGGGSGCQAPQDAQQEGATQPGANVLPGSESDLSETAKSEDPSYILQESGHVSCEPSQETTAVSYDRQLLTTGQYSQDFGAAVADFDGDDYSDIVLIGSQGIMLLLQGAKHTLDPSLDAFDPQDADTEAHGGTAADYDGDGDIDLFITRLGAPNLLLDNDGSAHFTDKAADRGVDGGNTHHSTASLWTDLDGDSDLDLVVAGHARTHGELADPSQIFLNDGTGHFQDRSHWIPAETHNAHTFIIGAPDFDRDGLPELYFINEHENATILWNQGGTGFTADNPEAHSGLEAPRGGMGLALGDVNSDGFEDVLVPSWGSMSLLLSAQFGSSTQWMDHAQVRGVVPDLESDQEMGWGAELGDLDNDGDLDAVVVFGAMVQDDAEGSGQPDAVFRNDGAGFFPVGEEWSLADESSGRGVVLADIDRNGWIDIVRPDLTGPGTVDFARCGMGSWLSIALRAPAPNTFGIGALVRVTTDTGMLERTIYAGGTGYASSGPPEVHVGLASASVASIEVLWPDGQVSSVGEVSTQQHLIIERTE